MFHLSNIQDIVKEFNNIYQNTEFIDGKLPTVNLKASLKYLLQNPNKEDLEYIEGRLLQLSKKIADQQKNYRNVQMACGRFLRFPKIFDVVNFDEAATCDDAVAVQVFNGQKFNLPTRIYFFRKCEKDSHFTDNLEFILGEKYPEFKVALEVERSQRKHGFKGDFYKDAVMTGVFPLHEASPILKHLDECFEKGLKPWEFIPAYEIGIYDEGDINATANL